MSRLNRNRKKRKLSQAIKEENSKKFDKAMDDHIETCKIIKRDYPSYSNMNPANALKLYHEIYSKLHNE